MRGEFFMLVPQICQKMLVENNKNVHNSHSITFQMGLKRLRAEVVLLRLYLLLEVCIIFGFILGFSS